MEKIYQVVSQDPGLDHLFDYLSAHRTFEGAVRYIKEEMGFTEIDTLEGEVYYCDPEDVDEFRSYHKYELYDIRHAYPRDYELKD